MIRAYLLGLFIAAGIFPSSAFQHWNSPRGRRNTSLFPPRRPVVPSSCGRLYSSSGEDAKLKPKVIVFDLDGCLWRPEMYELLWFSGGKGGPFRPDPKNLGSLLTCGDEPVYLLGDVGEIMKELYLDPFWADVKVGISSRTDEPNWARELLQKFEIIYGEDPETTFALEDVFASGPIEIAKDSKVEHFRRIASSCGVNMEDILFFDNESGNCREVARLGVTVAYAPDGVNTDIWEVATKEVFPQTGGKVIGVDILGYDTLEGANRFF